MGNLTPFIAGITETVLDNGLKVLVKETHAAPVVSCFIWYRVGSRHERPGITGVSHWVEHMLFKGTPQFPKEQIKRVIERNGGVWNGFTGQDYTAYFENLPADQVELGIRIEADRMQNCVFDPKEVESERTVILSEREGGENYPQFLLWEEVQGVAYQAHSYRWSVIGYRSDLEAMTRDDLYSYYKRYYVPNNATLILVGDFETDAVLAKVKEHFGSIPAGEQVEEPRTVEPKQRGERRVTVRREGTVRYVYIVYHIPSIEHPDLYPLTVLGTILSQGRSSRLYRHLVEGNIAVWAGFSPMQAKAPGLAWLAGQARDGITNEKLEEALLEQVSRVQEEGVQERELEKAINQTEANFVYEQEGVSRQASRIGYYETLISYKYLGTYLERIHSVTKEEVQRAAQEYLTEDNRTVGYFEPIATGSAKRPPTPPPPMPGMEMRAHFPAFGYDGTPPLTAQRPHSHTHILPYSHTRTSAQTAVSRIQPVREVLPNGLTIIVQEQHDLPTVAVMGKLKAGALFDEPDKPGVADFTANTLIKGTCNRSWEQIAEEIDFVGASLGAWGNKETMSWQGHCLPRHFDLLVEILADVLRNPVFPEEEVEKHRIQMCTLLKTWDDEPRQVAMKELHRLIYPPGHIYHRRPQGELEDVDAIARDDLLRFHHRYYRPDSLIMAVVGDVSAQEALEVIERWFGDWEKPEGSVTLEVPPVPLVANRSRLVIPMMDKSQVEIAMGHRGISRRNPDYYAADVMNRILGGSAGIGRLFNRVRDIEGLAYGVFCFFSPMWGEGPFLACAGVAPKNVERALDSIQRQIRLIRQDEPPTQEEVDDTINFITGSFALSIETNEGIARVLVDSELFGLGMDYPQKHAQLYRSVTRQQVIQAAHTYLHPDEMAVAIAGPYAEGATIRTGF